MQPSSPVEYGVDVGWRGARGVLSDAEISTWIVVDSFDTAQECCQERDRERTAWDRYVDMVTDHHQVPRLDARHALAATKADAAKCISSNDLRLIR
jgi:hypothetical protein